MKGEDEIKINQLRRANKSNTSASSLNRQTGSSRSLLGPADDDDDITIPDERDWRKEIQEIKKRTGDFNINNYIHVLTEYERIKYKKIIKKIPEDKRVYI